MAYKILPQTQAEEAKRAERFNNTSKRVLNKMVKYDMAQKKSRHSTQVTKKMLESSVDNYLRHSLALMQEIQIYYAWLRQKIQDPAIPKSHKFAYRKMAAILESRFSESLQRGNPLMNPAGGNKAAYGFCYTNTRIP